MVPAMTVCIIFIVVFIIYNYLLRKRFKREIQEKVALVKEIEAQLIQAEKMASLGTLAAGIAHEINNPLSFLLSNLESMRDYASYFAQAAPGGQEPSADAQHKKTLIEDFLPMTEESLDGALRIKKIVSDLRTFSRQDETKKIRLDINQILESTIIIIWNEIKYKITLLKDYQAKSAVLGDSTQLSQVFLNLLINAAQAIAEKGTIALSTYEDAKNVYIKIADTGSGIAPGNLSKIFDPFFSTKKGLGLGLSVSYNIIGQHRGGLKVDSVQGKGTTFTITLPHSLW